MRTFKRPMFRKGGNVGNGIMTGITDRVQAQDGFLPGSTAEMKGASGVTEEGIELAFPISSKVNVPDTTGSIKLGLPDDRPVPKYLSEEYTGGLTEADLGTPKTTAEYLAELKEGAGEYGGMDPLTSFLLTAGPSVAGATGFADAIGRLQPATQQLIKEADAKAKYDRDLRRAAVNLGLQEEQKFDDRRFNLLVKADDREYQKFLTDDERNYLAEVKADDRIYNKELIKNEREFNLELLKDQREYARLTEEDKRDYQEQIDAKARAYAKLDKEKQREYEEKLIKEGRAFELQQIIRKEEFQLKLLNKELDANDPFNQKNLAKVYFEEYKSKAPANNRATYEADNIKAEMIEKVGANNVDQDPLVGGGIHVSLENKKKNKNLGKVYYDVDTGEVKQLRKTKDGEFKFDIIDLETYVKPETPEVTTKDEDISKRFDYLNPGQRKFLEDLKQKTDDTPSA
tara:strand:+ start:384 stop:1754 length:1371 start_codon:yes stop_codon:yes gene_type:complete